MHIHVTDDRENKKKYLEIFEMVKKISLRNGSSLYYSLEIVKDEQGDNIYLTCDNSGLSPECSSEWLFSDVSDKEAITLLNAFIDSSVLFAFEVVRHLSRLMAVRGNLVKQKMDEIVDIVDWSSYSSPASLLSYLASKSEGGDRIIRLLDVVPNDSRDGLFTACWYCSELCVHEKLLKNFEEWICDEAWGTGDGEGAWLYRFLGKWITENTFTFARLEKLVVWQYKWQHNSL